MKNEIFKLYLIVACILLAFCCYINYDGWNRCYKNKEYIADDLYKLQKTDKMKQEELFKARLDVRRCEVKIAELQAKLNENRIKIYNDYKLDKKTK